MPPLREPRSASATGCRRSGSMGGCSWTSVPLRSPARSTLEAARPWPPTRASSAASRGAKGTIRFQPAAPLPEGSFGSSTGVASRKTPQRGGAPAERRDASNRPAASARRRPKKAACGRQGWPLGVSRAGGWLLPGSAQLFADDELEAGPGVVDGADVHVDEAEGEGDFANDVLGDIGRDLRGLLGPGDPDDGGGPELFAAGGERFGEGGALGGEDVNEVDGGPRASRRGGQRPGGGRGGRGR